MTHQLDTYGLILVFFLVAIEGCGIPLPGETALIAAAVLAGSGHFNIVAVIAVAAAGAITGDNSGYWIARLGGRALLERIPIVREALPRFLPLGERYFAKHGPKTVAIARFIAGLRITAAWLAGLSRMPWRRFALYNAIGATAWATVIGIAAYEFGQKAVSAVTHYGLWAIVAIVAIAVVLFAGNRFLHKRAEKRNDANHGNSESESPLPD